MTREEFAKTLAAIERALITRTPIIKEIVDEKGEKLGEIFRGSFQRKEGD